MAYDEKVEEYVKANLNYDRFTGDLHWTCEGGFNRNTTKPAGTVVGDGYKSITTIYGLLKCHKICWYLAYGSWPDKHIDHIDGNKENNRLDNLRLVTNQQNSFNARGHKDGSSRFKGVFLEGRSGKWLARISKSGKSKHIGYFSCEVEAAKAYNKAAKELFGEFARLNDV